MAKKEDKALAATTNNAMVPVPDFVDEGRVGFENVSGMTFERITLLQQMSPELQSDDSLQAGMVFRKSTNEVLYTPGAAAIGFSIGYYFKEWVQFGDRDDPSSPVVVARTTDPSSKMAEESRQWVKIQRGGKEVRKVTDVHNFVILRDDCPHDPVLLTCMRSNQRYGTGLLNLANGRGDVPMYAGRFLVYSEKETNKRNQTYWVYKFKNPPREADQFWGSREMYTAAKTLYEMLSEAHKDGRLGAEYGKEDQGEEAPPTPDAEL